MLVQQKVLVIDVWRSSKNLSAGCIIKLPDSFTPACSLHLPKAACNSVIHPRACLQATRNANAHLIQAANYLCIEPLLDLACLTTANMIKGKTPEEIRTKFNIKVLSSTFTNQLLSADLQHVHLGTSGHESCSRSRSQAPSCFDSSRFHVHMAIFVT